MEGQSKYLGEHKIIFIVTSVIYFVYWLILCIHLVNRWHVIDHSLHSDALGLLIYPLALWTLLYREKASGFSMAAACLFFVTSINVAFHVL